MASVTNQNRCLANDPLHEISQAVMRHPGFEVAAMRYAGNVVGWRKRLGRFNRVGTNLGFHIVNYTMYLDFARRAGQSEQGATYSAILEICESRKQCGGRALRTVLTLLTVLGHLRVERLKCDARIRVYVPSDRMIQEATDIYGYAMGALEELVPNSDYGRRIEDDPTLLWQLISRSGRAIIEDGIRITEHFPELDRIISQAGGLPTTISLTHANMTDASMPSTREIAKNFTISPSQVRAVLAAADEAGLINRSKDGDIADVGPLVAAHKGLLARELALHIKYTLGLEDHFRQSAN